MPRTQPAPGRLAFETYRDTLHPTARRPLRWEDQSDEVRAAWLAAAEKILDTFGGDD